MRSRIVACILIGAFGVAASAFGAEQEDPATKLRTAAFNFICVNNASVADPIVKDRNSGKSKEQAALTLQSLPKNGPRENEFALPILNDAYKHTQLGWAALYSYWRNVCMYEKSTGKKPKFKDDIYPVLLQCQQTYPIDETDKESFKKLKECVDAAFAGNLKAR